MRKPTKHWKPVLLRWKQSLPNSVRRLLRRRWLTKAEHLADQGDELIARGRDYTIAARLIDPPAQRQALGAGAKPEQGVDEKRSAAK